MTQTTDGHPGHPLNVALIGSEAELGRALGAAGWQPTAPWSYAATSRSPRMPFLLVRTRTRRLAIYIISVRTLAGKIWLLSRRETTPAGATTCGFGAVARVPMVDEQPGLAQHRSICELDSVIRPGQITHHISPNVDAERDYLFKTKAAQVLAEIYAVEGFHSVRTARNGGGDP